MHQPNNLGLLLSMWFQLAIKLAMQLVNYQQSNDTKDFPLIAVSYFTTLKKNIVQEELQNAGAVVITTKYETADIVFIAADKKIINAIAALPFVSSLNLQTLKDKPLNYKSSGSAWREWP